VSIDYDLGDGQKLTEVIPVAKVRELTVRMRVRRVRRC
jgi:hypothetical protein